jgi:hypothetical protein
MKDRKFYVYTLPGAEMVAAYAVPVRDDDGMFTNLGEGPEKLKLVAEMLAADQDEAIIRYTFSYLDAKMANCSDKAEMLRLKKSRADNWTRYRAHQNGPSSIRF